MTIEYTRNLFLMEFWHLQSDYTHATTQTCFAKCTNKLMNPNNFFPVKTFSFAHPL